MAKKRKKPQKNQSASISIKGNSQPCDLRKIKDDLFIYVQIDHKNSVPIFLMNITGQLIKVVFDLSWITSLLLPFTGLFPTTYLIGKQKDFLLHYFFKLKISSKVESLYSNISNWQNLLNRICDIPSLYWLWIFSGEFGQKFSVISDHIYIKEQGTKIYQSELGTNFPQQYNQNH